jgi:hypothetical protein
MPYRAIKTNIAELTSRMPSISSFKLGQTRSSEVVGIRGYDPDADRYDYDLDPIYRLLDYAHEARTMGSLSSQSST